MARKCKGGWPLMRLDGKGPEDIALQMRRNGHPCLNSWREGLDQGEWAATLVMATLWGRQVDEKEKTLSWVTPRFWLISDMESLSQGTLRTERV